MAKAPSPPDPYAAAAAGAAANTQAAQTQSRMNAVDQSNPYGTSVFTRDSNGDPTGLTNSLSAPLQGLLGGQVGNLAGLQGKEGDLTGNLNTGGLTPFQPTQFNTQFQTTSAPSPFQTTSFNPSNYDSAAANNVFQGEMALLKPQFDAQTTAQNVNLTDRGLPIGSEARNTAEQQLQANQNSAMTGAAGQAQAQGFNQGYTGANFNAGQNQAQFSNQLANSQFGLGQNTQAYNAALQNAGFGAGQNQASFTNEVTGNQVPYSNLATLTQASNPMSLLGMAPSAGVPQSQVAAAHPEQDIYNSYQGAVNQANTMNAQLGSGALGLGRLALMA